ncbi:Zinc finger protein 26 [Folsomia candida]|uniref:Zinc finger protein 26 n=1 Tax=Folsomia candida TaxID=158441 RepID=A0A226DA98_FOLCA|nr:Zinc finger protein 26 [Folsomia candida]
MNPTTEKSWKCVKCSKIFEQKQYLDRRAITHETNSQVKCEICSKKLKNRLVLYTHMQNFHSNKAKQRCKVCNAEFAMIRELRGHMERRHKSREERPRLPCTFSGCPKTFLDKVNLANHFKQQHAQNAVRYPCTLCGKEFTQKQNLDRHIATHTTEKRFNDMNESEQRTHMKKAERPAFPCRLCPLIFYSQQGISFHVKNHHDQKKYFCTICDKILRSSHGLKYHIRASHPTNEAPTYSFEYCEYQSRIKENLTSHVTRMHVGVKGKECYFCGKKFYNFFPLASHCSRIHTLEK